MWAAVGPWAVVAIVALVVALLGFAILMVRSAKSDMRVRIGKLVEISRGKIDPPAPRVDRPQLRSVDPPDDGPSARSG
jgi:hypothetical protein